MRFWLILLILTHQIYSVTLVEMMQAFHDIRFENTKLALQQLENPNKQLDPKDLEKLEQLKIKANTCLRDATGNDGLWNNFMQLDGWIQEFALLKCSKNLEAIKSSSPFVAAKERGQELAMLCVAAEDIRTDLMRDWINSNSLVGTK